MNVSYILDVIESTKSVNSGLKFLWRLSPLFDGLLSLVLHELDTLQDSSTEKKSPFSPGMMGCKLIYLVLTSFAFSAVVLATDLGVFSVFDGTVQGQVLLRMENLSKTKTKTL
ncbi:unnamed protein product [Phytophthora lilii]|uniref:Unnamed protein product n=1 Tax=Phytophthora lilii TaxID=2077276 RepID=A0A9W6YLL6_9STRA|nr:unnamed protein product [Phytophthora lilii]